jgi:hypothetical protein
MTKRVRGTAVTVAADIRLTQYASRDDCAGKIPPAEPEQAGCAVDALPTLRGPIRSVGAKSRRVAHGSCALIGLACRRSGAGRCQATSPRPTQGARGRPERHGATRLTPHNRGLWSLARRLHSPRSRVTDIVATIRGLNAKGAVSCATTVWTKTTTAAVPGLAPGGKKIAWFTDLTAISCR